jgi:hypothetical protein
MRKHLTWNCKNFRGAADLRGQMIRVNGAGDVADCLARFSSQPFEESRRALIAVRDQSAEFTSLRTCPQCD